MKIAILVPAVLLIEAIKSLPTAKNTSSQELFYSILSQ